MSILTGKLSSSYSVIYWLYQLYFARSCLKTCLHFSGVGKKKEMFLVSSPQSLGLLKNEGDP